MSSTTPNLRSRRKRRRRISVLGVFGILVGAIAVVRDRRMAENEARFRERYD